ncbi:hypothetical protein BRADI_3g13898v3 [Brachypodium distachyon]|uniref:Uncharacterized protein n=1 Tax=Brachypodium distachyon TaxID=15368 RepID=A0A0Q3LQR5_BRADI|nr:hypothetical protein BRADI_3g13898v3 [Brachypodium distachyon]
MGSKMIGAFLLVLLAVFAVSDAQVLPTPCCRFSCCDGKPECCDPGYIPAVAPAAAAVAPAVSAGAKAEGPAPFGGVSGEASAGN